MRHFIMGNSNFLFQESQHSVRVKKPFQLSVSPLLLLLADFNFFITYWFLIEVRNANFTILFLVKAHLLTEQDLRTTLFRISNLTLCGYDPSSRPSQACWSVLFL